MSSLASGGSLAGIARVAFEATGVGETTRDIERVERAYRSTTGEMSDAAIRVELAQNRLQRTLRKGPSAFREQASAELALRRAEQELRGETDRLTRSQRSAEQGLGRFSRGAVAGSGLFRGLGRSVAFASTAFLGGTGLVYAIRQSITAAIEQDKILANLRNSLQAGGHSWATYGQRITEATAKTKAISAFDDEELYTSLQLLIRGTGDVNKALELNALAADVARGRNMGLVQAATLLVRVNAGQVGSLRRLGIQVDKGISGTKALEQVQRQYAGAAEAFGNSAAGATARFQVGIQDLEKAIGRGILPQFTKLANAAADWLNQAENQKRVERDVAQVTETLADAARGLAGGFKEVKAVAEPLVDALGGTERTVKLALEAMAVYKLAKIAAGVRGIATAFGFVGPAATRAAAEAVIAENAIGTGAVVNAGKVGLLGRALGFGLSTAGITTALLAGGDIVSRGPTKGQNDLREYPRLYQVFLKILGKVPLTKKEREAWKTAIGGNLVTKTGRTNASESQLQRGEAMLAKGAATTFPGAPVVPGSHPGQGGKPQPPTTDGTTSGQPARFTFAKFESGIAALQESELDAAATAGQADDLRVAKRRLALARRALRELKLTREQRIQVKQERNRALQDIAAIEQQEDQAAAQVSADRMARIRQREATLVNRVEAAKLTKKLSDDRAALKALIAFYREESKNMDLAVSARQAFQKKRIQTLAKLKALDDDDSAAVDKAVKQAQSYYDRMNKALGKHDFSTRAGLRAAALKYVDASGKPKTGAGLTEADVRRLQFDFLSKLTGEIGQWGSNFQSDSATSGQMATNSHVQTQLLQRQNSALQRLIEGSWHAGAQLASAELSAAGWGVGF